MVQVSPSAAVRLLLKVSPLLVYKFRLVQDEAVYYYLRQLSHLETFRSLLLDRLGRAIQHTHVRGLFVNNLCYLIFRDPSINNQFHSILLSVEILTKTVRGPSQIYYSNRGGNFISLETDIGG